MLRKDAGRYAAAALSSLLAITAAQAQSTIEATAAVAVPSQSRGVGTNADTPPSGDDGQLDEIVVTAEKRSANLQSVPISVAAIQGDALFAAGATSVRGLDTLVSGVKVQGVNSPAVFIRGIGTSNATVTGDQGVALHLDGVYQSRPTAFAAGFVDVDRVEVLKGPQGTLYGRGALGGNINVISNAPKPYLEGAAALQIGNYNQVVATGVANAPLTDDLAIRLAFQTDRHDRYSGPVGDNLDSVTGRLRVRYAPTGDLTLNLTAFHTERGGEGAAYHRARSYTAFPRQRDPWSNAIDNSQFLKAKTTELSGQVDLDLGAATLTYIPAHTWDRYDATSPSLINRPAPFSLGETVQSNLMTHELRLASPSGGRLEYTAGLFYMDEKIDYEVNFLPFIRTFGQFNTRSVAAFGQATFEIFPDVRLIGGIRQNRDTKKQDTNFGNRFRRSWNSTTGKLGIDWKVAPANLLYFTVSDGFKAGGFFTAPAPNNFDPERVRSFELGSKNRFFDNHLQMNGSLFWNNYSDYQASAFVPGFNGSVVRGVINAGRARLRGFELETIASVSPADRFDVSVTFVDSAFTALRRTATTAQVGDQMPFSPRWSGNVGYQHVFALKGSDTLTLRGESHVESSSWLSLNHRAFTGQDGYHKSTAMLTYATSDERYTVGAWIRNIENVAVRTAVNDVQDFENFVLAEPRTYGVSLGAKF